MSYTSRGPGWWQASDGRWYPPEQHPNAAFAYRYPVRQSTNGLAVASLVLAIVGILGIGAILAIIFGIVARRQIRESGGAQTGEGLALAGIIVGICQIVLSAAAIALLVIGLSTTLPRFLGAAACQSDADRVQSALQDYRTHNGTYPVVPATWSKASYVDNYAPLTSSTNGGPWLQGVPPTTGYVIEYDSEGHVWVEGPGRYDSSYNSTRDTTSPEACLAATG